MMTNEDLVAYDPDVIICCPCGFNIDRCEKDARKILYGEQSEWFCQLRAVQANNVFVADGNQYFSRPSPRLVEGIGILAEILHGISLFPGEDEKRWRQMVLGAA